MDSRRSSERLSEALVTRFREARFALEPAALPASAFGQSGARAAGSLVEIHLELEQTGALRARFRAYGDPSTIAAADWICEQLDGERLGASVPAVADCVRALNLPGKREHAAGHAVAAMHAALDRLS